jgi:hypothetical protein
MMGSGACRMKLERMVAPLFPDDRQATTQTPFNFSLRLPVDDRNGNTSAGAGGELIFLPVQQM